MENSWLQFVLRDIHQCGIHTWTTIRPDLFYFLEEATSFSVTCVDWYIIPHQTLWLRTHIALKNPLPYSHSDRISPYFPPFPLPGFFWASLRFYSHTIKVNIDWWSVRLECINHAESVCQQAETQDAHFKTGDDENRRWWWSFLCICASIPPPPQMSDRGEIRFYRNGCCVNLCHAKATSLQVSVQVGRQHCDLILALASKFVHSTRSIF